MEKASNLFQVYAGTAAMTSTLASREGKDMLHCNAWGNNRKLEACAIHFRVEVSKQQHYLGSLGKTMQALSPQLVFS